MRGKATLRVSTHETFENGALSYTCVLAESHLSIHTFPESDSCEFDAYTCGETCDPEAMLDEVVSKMRPKEITLMKISRRNDEGFEIVKYDRCIKL